MCYVYKTPIRHLSSILRSVAHTNTCRRWLYLLLCTTTTIEEGKCAILPIFETQDGGEEEDCPTIFGWLAH